MLYWKHQIEIFMNGRIYIMNLMTKMQPVFIIAAALLGLLFGYTTPVGSFSVNLIEPFLMVLLFCVFLSVDGQKFKNAFLNLKFTISAVAVNFIWTPIFTFILGMLFFRHSLDLQMGLMMLMVTPCTDWYLVFTGIANGNVELGASILPLNLLLQILLMPVYLLLFFGSSVHFNVGAMLGNVLLVLIIPFGAAVLLKWIGRKNHKAESMVMWLQKSGDNIQLVFLCLAVISMFASESKEVINNPELLLRMMIPLLIFFAVNFVLVRFIGKKEKLPQKDIVALNFTTLARNSPLSLAVAVAAFPDRPLISLALVIGPLIELPVLGIIASISKQIGK